ncbi:TetR/AcrR family transcriptional regulator [Rhodococcus sp. IEGM 1379]|uniref:TetR/AcrR family transcriptional regulator n=1 Tax=Rhodococcus sp. IEGM 1379 TaxID=3047086 RepID=UPI0024B69757|nr:TetR/AcrR family transcriptional regulator [Rhodococcus sp. IEGM 1379]MDI9917843.1 WHG domain-containing protein [Rhodococcus sp. IEGM 1379]
MAETPRMRAREQTLQDITRIGREQLAAVGAAGLSLRAVARDLGVVSSAVYRYVASRDELLTLLVVDGYNELGAEVDEAVNAVASEDYRGQFLALGRALRVWALREPARYGLLFGSPVPGYHAPGEETTGPGTRVVTRLIAIIDGAYRSGALAQQQDAELGEPLTLDLERVRIEMDVELSLDAVARGTLVWVALFGSVNFEVFGQYGSDTFAEPVELFERHLTLLAEIAGLK